MCKSTGITIIMPTYNQGAFLARAVSSLLLQDFLNWELIIINDGSSDYTQEIIGRFSSDERIRVFNNNQNMGLGFCLNRGIDQARSDLIAYLPSDDIYYKNHLSSLYESMIKGNSVLVYSGVVHNYEDLSTRSYGRETEGIIEDSALQLVQVLHKKTSKRWIERNELVTDDLNLMYWNRLKMLGNFEYAGKVSCEWVDHPEQRHKITNESHGGGIYLYKKYYNVSQPIKFKSSIGNYIDEVAEYENFRNKSYAKSDKSLKILIVGELAYNAERICAFEERGHQLYGLWIQTPDYYNTVGPLPFGNVTDVRLENLEEFVSDVKPDIIYAMLNHQAVPLANLVMRAGLDVPFIWHFKEGPFVSRQNGFWKELIELYTNADGKIFTNQETKEWFDQFLEAGEKYLLLDGDLPKVDYFGGYGSPLLSDIDGEIHTVIAGRPYGIGEEHIRQLAEQKIHMHFYGDIQHAYWQNFIYTNRKYAPGYIHIHPNCKPRDWVSEFSKYDAGWLHIFECNNNKEYLKARWPDLNYPARMSTLAAAGVPMILRDNTGHIIASQSLIEKLDIGVLFNTIEDLADKLKDKERMLGIRKNIQMHKYKFSFDYHADELISFFQQVINQYKKESISIN